MGEEVGTGSATGGGPSIKRWCSAARRRIASATVATVAAAQHHHARPHAGSIEQARQEAANAQHNLKQAHSWVRQRPILIKLLHQLGPRYLDREGGYTRVLKVSLVAFLCCAARASGTRSAHLLSNLSPPTPMTPTWRRCHRCHRLYRLRRRRRRRCRRLPHECNRHLFPMCQLARRRAGDQAPMAVIEYVDREGELRQAKPPTGNKGESADEDGVVELLVK